MSTGLPSIGVTTTTPPRIHPALRGFVLIFLLVSPVAGPFTASPALANSLLVHLPSTPVENAGRRAAAIQELADIINEAIPGLKLTPQIFRRHGDAEAFLASHEDVVLVLSDAAWVSSLPTDLVPGFGVVRDGATTYRRLVVAKGQARRLTDLRGKRLAIVGASGGADIAFLRERVFGGEIEPTEWFGPLSKKSDDSEVITDILYGDADAGVVAEFNSLLAQHLGPSLQLIYTSGDLSLPVLSLSQRLDAESQRALEVLLTDLATSSPKILLGLGFDAFNPLDAASRSALRKTPSRAIKRFELPTPPVARLEALAPPAETLLPLVLELPLPEPPSAARELLAGEAGAEQN